MTMRRIFPSGDRSALGSVNDRYEHYNNASNFINDTQPKHHMMNRNMGFTVSAHW